MATMADVARRAGVSLSTVSYVLSGKRAISDETKRRVVQAMEALEFEPHAPGRALASRRAKTLGLLFPSPSKGINELQLEFMTSAAEAAAAHGYAFHISVEPTDDAELLQWTRRGAVDGLILMEIGLHDRRVALLRDRGFPFTMIGHCQDNDGLSFVDFDFADAVAVAGRYLAELGHRRVALVNSSAARVAADYGPAVRSAEGFEAIVAEVGLAGVSTPCELSPAGGYAAMRHLLGTDRPPSAVITINREAIPGLLQAAIEHGLRVPDDLSLVALIPAHLADLFTPALTTVDFPAVEMGRLGADLLIRRLEGGDAAPVHRLLRGDLTIRESSGPCRDGR
jgi:DNA-binding LacI/PurR family transcriptional regulator